jgi:hypothetical protein
MKQRNCPNCGAPYNVELNTCPYCGTSYFDMSAIDINETNPFYLKLKMGDMIFTSKVIAEPEITVNFYEDTYSALGRYGEVGRVVVNSNIDIDMRFKSVYNPNQVLCTLEVKDDVD